MWHRNAALAVVSGFVLGSACMAEPTQASGAAATTAPCTTQPQAEAARQVEKLRENRVGTIEELRKLTADDIAELQILDLRCPAPASSQATANSRASSTRPLFREDDTDRSVIEAVLKLAREARPAERPQNPAVAADTVLVVRPRQAEPFEFRFNRKIEEPFAEIHSLTLKEALYSLCGAKAAATVTETRNGKAVRTVVVDDITNPDDTSYLDAMSEATRRGAVKVDLVDLEGRPLGIINPFGSQLVSDAMEAEEVRTEPLIQYYSNPLFVALQLPRTFDAKVVDTVTATLQCRATGETATLALTESGVKSLDFRDATGEFSVVFQAGRRDASTDDVGALDPKMAEMIVVGVASKKFGKPIRGGMELWETGPDSHVFKNKSISGTLTLSAAAGPNRTWQLDCKRDSVAIKATLTETGPDSFGKEGEPYRLKIIPSWNSPPMTHARADRWNKLFMVLSDTEGKLTDEVLYATSTDVLPLVLRAKVPEDGVAFEVRASGRPEPGPGPTLAELDETVKKWKAYRVKVTGLPRSFQLPRKLRARSLDMQGQEIEHVDVDLVRDPRDPSVLLSEPPILPYSGGRDAKMVERYGREYRLLDGGADHAIGLVPEEPGGPAASQPSSSPATQAQTGRTFGELRLTPDRGLTLRVVIETAPGQKLLEDERPIHYGQATSFGQEGAPQFQVLLHKP